MMHEFVEKEKFWYRIIGLHLAKDTHRIPLHTALEFSDGAGLYKKKLDRHLEFRIMKPIMDKMRQHRATEHDLKALLFMHLCFEFDPHPAVCLLFVDNSF